MSLYSVMLVDDEEEVIQIIIKKLDWASMGFQIVGYAHNGAEALELAEECQPDVVMTDIKMPYMDGLELSRRLKERYPSIRIIIFSGFDEFEYAKEAIRIEVEEYILKPIDAGELQELFGRIKNPLIKKSTRSGTLTSFRNTIWKACHFSRRTFLPRFLRAGCLQRRSTNIW